MRTIILFLQGVGIQEILLIGIFVLVFFGAKKIPEFMKGLGKGVREFKEGVKDFKGDIEGTSASSNSAAPPKSITPENVDRNVKIENQPLG